MPVHKIPSNAHNLPSKLLSFQSGFHRSCKNPSDPPQKLRQVPTCVQAFDTLLNHLPFNLGPEISHSVLPPLSVQLKPRLPPPIPLVQITEDESEPINPPSPFDAQPQIRFPKIQFRQIETRLRIQIARVRRLCGQARSNILPDSGDLSLHSAAVRGGEVALAAQSGNGGVHFGRLGLLLPEGGVVLGGLLREDLEVAFLHLLVFVQLGHVDAEVVPLLQDALAALGDEVVEAVCEAGHAGAELVEAEVDGGEGVGH